MASVTPADRLRTRVGEPIPLGGTAADTLFSDLEIRDLLFRNGDDVDDCMVEAWEIKAAKLSTLVDISEGDQRRSLSQAYTAALKQAEYFKKHDSSSSGPRTSIHRIDRGGFQG